MQIPTGLNTPGRTLRTFSKAFATLALAFPEGTQIDAWAGTSPGRVRFEAPTYIRILRGYIQTPKRQNMKERVQKLMAHAGIDSRRGCEKYIAQGRVTVNGKVAKLGTKADPKKDRILFDGNPIGDPEPMVYIALHKARDVISASKSPDSRPTVVDLVDSSARLYPVGRLDTNSEGLILLTNDGELTHRLTHPSFEHEKEYRVLVARHPHDEQLTAWRNGIVLENGYRTAPADVRITKSKGKGAWLRLVLREGRNRQIRRMGRQTGLPIVRIIRVRIKNLRLGNLKPYQWRHLTNKEIADLKK
ncbi:MAG: pseudouridine synthase [Chloroflexota bacterium]|nr:pseudouridine synthase [Chloroflexota bacterium]